MPGAARADGQDTVNTVHPATGTNCAEQPLIIATDEGSKNVFANTVGIVRISDNSEPHPFPGCSQHATPLVGGSSDVLVNFRGAGREGDAYSCEATITSGSKDVIING